MTNATGAVYEFGSFRLDTAKRLLTRGGEHLTLPPKTFDLLLLLVESHGRVFAKKELMATLWPNTFVEDANLSFQVSALRKILGGEGIDWIETLPRYGYRFAGNVLEVDTHPPIQIPVWTPPETAPAPEAKLPAKVGGRRIPLYYWLTMGVVTIIAGYLAVVHFSEKLPEKLPISFLITPPDLVTISDVDPIAVSPNGDRVLFMGEGPEGGKQLWVRALGSLTASVIAGTEQVDGAFWSPDGRSIAFVAAGKLKKTDLQSGVPQTIGDTPSSSASGSWSPNGVILFQTNQRPEIFRLAPGTDQPKAATHLNLSNHEIRHSAPQFLPDGRRFIYFVQSERPENSGIYLGSLDGSASQRLTNSSASAVYTRVMGTNYLLFARDTNLMGQAFDVATGKLIGTAFVVAPRLLIGDSGGHPRAALSASQNGVLAYRTRGDTGATDLIWMDRSGRRLGSVGESGEFSNPALSPDGKKLLISRMDSQIRTRDLWLHDFGAGSFLRLTFNAADETNPVWSPDGSRIAYDALQEGVIDLYEMEIAGGSGPKLLLHTNENKYIHDWSPDGSLLLFRIGTMSWALPRDGGKLLGPYAMDNLRISPNRRWVAYTSKKSGRSEVYVQSFPPSGTEMQISTLGGTEPSWRADGNELYYANGDNLCAVQVKTDGRIFKHGALKRLFSVRLEKTARRSRYQATSNGQRFLVNIPRESSSPITVSTNWLPLPSR